MTRDPLSAAFRLKHLLKIPTKDINAQDLNEQASTATSESREETPDPEVEKHSKVPFYSETLYEPLRKKRAPKNTHLLCSDGSIGYGGCEYISEVFTQHTAPEAKQYKWNVLWKELPVDIRANIRCDSVSLFSVTDIVSANAMSEAILKLEGVSRESLVVDATACIGGNTFSFLKYFSWVVAVELDQARARILQENVSLLGGRNVEIIQGDCLQEIPRLSGAKVVFFDPPWGGEKYKQRQSIELFLGGKKIGAVCNELRAFTEYFALKLPVKNVDEVHLVASSGCKLVKVVSIGSKMRLMLLKSH